MKINRYLHSVLLFLLVSCSAGADNPCVVTSPNGRLQLKISADEQLSYQILLDEEPISEKCTIGMKVRNRGILGENAVIKSVTRNTVKGTIPVLFGENDEVEEHYNEMILDLDGFSLICRAYDEGVAYRFATNFKGGIIVENEIVEFEFPETPVIHLAFEEEARTMSHWELPYSKLNSLDEFPLNDYAINPIMFKNEETGLGITVVESYLEDYPGMYLLKAEEGNKLIGKFAEYPDKIENANKYESQKVLTRFDYIANTIGTREFPWRGFIITHDDKDLLNNDLIFKLAKPQVLEDTSWIQAGRTAWDWLHDGELEGVDFEAGPGIERTLEFYKFYVDFAAENGFEFMTLDAGWDSKYIEELCQYAAAKNVKIFVWTFFNFVLKDEPMLDDFKKWGIAGIKVDFIARDDQIATTWLTTMAERCAKRELTIIMHGSPKPTGLQRAYPNILNYEGIVGEEHNKWNSQCNPNYRTTYPFLRLLGGPADITPGSLRNKTRLGFRVKDTGAPNSLGTRAHQMAIYVVNDQPLGFISDAPTEYRKHPEIMEFLSKVPTVWNETKPLKGAIGEYILTARRSGKEWYVGGITNWTQRTMEIDLSFLEKGVEYKAYIIKDDPEKNNDAGFRKGDATVCIWETIDVTKETILTVDLAQGGGVAIRIYPDPNSSTIETIKEADITAWYNKEEQAICISSGESKLDLLLTDVVGRVITTKNNLTNSYITLPLSGVSNGTYILNCIGENFRKSIKFYIP